MQPSLLSDLRTFSSSHKETLCPLLVTLHSPLSRALICSLSLWICLLWIFHIKNYIISSLLCLCSFTQHNVFVFVFAFQTRKIYFLTVPETGLKGVRNLISSEASLFSLWMAAFSLCPHVGFPPHALELSFQGHPCCNMYQYFILFYCQIIFHCMAILHFVFPFRFPLFGYYE